MSAYAYTDVPARPGWIARTLNWLDERGPISWIVVMVGSFIFAGPLGLLVLGFILITGRADKEIIDTGRKLGMNNFLKKPFTPQDLRACIEAVVGRL